MGYYLETIKRKTGVRYRIVRDVTREGKRDRTYHTLPAGTTKETAKKICCEMNLNADFGDFLQKKSMLFSDYVEQVYFPKYTLYLSPTTKNAYEQMYKTKDGVRDCLGHYTLTEVTVEVLQDMVNRYVKMGKSPKTIRNYLYFISAILKEAMSDNYIKRQESTACAYVRLPKPSGVEGNAYTISQVKTMLERASQTQNRAMELLVAVCCLAGGLRRSELIGLRWEDIVLDKKEAYIKVQRSIVQVKNQLIEKETKTKSGRRTIPLAVGGTVYQILERARKEHMKFQSEPGFEGGNSVFIMNQEPHVSFTPMELYKNYKRFMKNDCPDLPCYRLHDLRHTYFTICSNVEGFSELSMIGTGGHSTVQSSKRYQHSQFEKMRDDMQKLDDAFAQAQ